MKKIESLQDILPAAFKNLGLKKKYNAEWAILHWRNIVGEEIAAKASPASVQYGTLLVYVSNSVWCHHLSMMKNDIINKINGFIGEKLIRDIRFQAGYSEKYPNNELDEEKPSNFAAKIRSVQLNENDIQQVQSMSSSVSEEQLRKQTMRILKKHFAHKRLKNINSWHKCASCDSLCPKEATYCTVCSIEHRRNKMSTIRKLLLEAPWLTYAEMRKYAECTAGEFIQAKTDLLLSVSQEINYGQADKVKILTLVMLATNAKPDVINENLIQRTLDKFRRKKYVSTSGV